MAIRLVRARSFERSILVIHRNMAEAVGIAELLRPFGATVSTLDSTASARRALSAAIPDLIILDLASAGSVDWHDGITLLEQFRRTRPHLLARTLVMADAPSDYLQPFLGDVPLIEKPFDLADFWDLVGLWATRPPTFFAGLGDDWITNIGDLLRRNP